MCKHVIRLNKAKAKQKIKIKIKTKTKKWNLQSWYQLCCTEHWSASVRRIEYSIHLWQTIEVNHGCSILVIYDLVQGKNNACYASITREKQWKNAADKRQNQILIKEEFSLSYTLVALTPILRASSNGSCNVSLLGSFTSPALPSPEP